MSNANNCFVSFMMGKFRVAPAKPLTVPRLELCASVIAVRLAKFETRELDVTPEKNCVVICKTLPNAGLFLKPTASSTSRVGITLLLTS